MKTHSTSLDYKAKKYLHNQRRQTPASSSPASQYRNYAVLLQIYTLNKTEAAASKKIRLGYTTPGSRAEKAASLPMSSSWKIKQVIGQILEAITPLRFTAE